jgi:hypothetical protein
MTPQETKPCSRDGRWLYKDKKYFLLRKEEKTRFHKPAQKGELKNSSSNRLGAPVAAYAVRANMSANSEDNVSVNAKENSSASAEENAGANASANASANVSVNLSTNASANVRT